MKRLSKLLFRLRDRRSDINSVAFYMYHGVIWTPLAFEDWCFVDASTFLWQLKILRENYKVISLTEAVDHLQNGRISQPTAVITLDDGFQNNYDAAYSTLKELGLPATIFLTTGFIDTEETLWYCRLHRALARSSRASLRWDGFSFDLLTPRARSRSSAKMQARLKQFPPLRLVDEVRRIVLMLGDNPDAPIPRESPYRMLGREAIVEMARSGLIEFGAHTASHAILSFLSPDERFHEIKSSIAAVESLTGQPCRVFAYPNGQPQDYDEDSVRVLRACGIQAAVTAMEGFNDPTTPLMQLKRFGVGSDMSRDQFRRMVRMRSGPIRV